MKIKEILKPIIFIAIFLLLLRSVTYIIRTNGQPKDAWTGFYAEKKDSVDIVMVGASAVFPFYSAPQIYGETGITCYPLSSGNQNTKAIRYIIEEARKTQPDVMPVIELRMFLYEDKGVFGNYSFIRGVTDNMKYSLHRIRTIDAVYPEPDYNYAVEDKLSFYFDIIKYHSNWKTMVLPDQIRCAFYEKKHPLKGYQFETGLIPNEAYPIDPKIAPQPMSADQEQVLRDLIAWLKEENLDALFIVSPFYDVPQDQAVFRSMGEIIESEGYPFLDMNLCYDEVGTDFATDYYDGDGHVNAMGSEKVSRYFGEYLKEHYEFTDHRSDPKYASWDKAYALWQEEQQEALGVIEEKIATGNYDSREADGN
ncbi:MAG: SGNH/GDSL hydrolase family protein [Lachnospiraceae bacterium]|nr:SGNH/GDSL hydrolase family protein [Lachnospiraceae bacterium]